MYPFHFGCIVVQYLYCVLSVSLPIGHDREDEQKAHPKSRSERKWWMPRIEKTEFHDLLHQIAYEIMIIDKVHCMQQVKCQAKSVGGVRHIEWKGASNIQQMAMLSLSNWILLVCAQVASRMISTKLTKLRIVQTLNPHTKINRNLSV